MPHDPEKVPLEYADLFYHGKPGPNGEAVGNSDEEYDALKARLTASGDWPFNSEEES